MTIKIVEKLLKEVKYNCFELLEKIEGVPEDLHSELACYLPTLLKKVKMNSEEKSLLKQSCKAFVAASTDLKAEETFARIFNEEVVSDSTGSDDDEDVEKRVKSIQRWGSRLKAKESGSRDFFQGKVQSMETLLSRYPDIGKTIERFVSEANVGADQWRRTEVLAFHGNQKIPNKVT